MSPVHGADGDQARSCVGGPGQHALRDEPERWHRCCRIAARTAPFRGNDSSFLEFDQFGAGGHAGRCSSGDLCPNLDGHADTPGGGRGPDAFSQRNLNALYTHTHADRYAHRYSYAHIHTYTYSYTYSHSDPLTYTDLYEHSYINLHEHSHADTDKHSSSPTADGYKHAATSPTTDCPQHHTQSRV